jgi:hypothetical protein
VTSPDIESCLLGIRLPYHRSSRVSHPGTLDRNFRIFSYVSCFRIAIWNRNVMVSLVSIGVWLCGLALHIRSTFRTLDCSYRQLIRLMGLPLTCACKGLTMVSFTGVLFVDSTDQRSCKPTKGSRDVQPHFRCLHSPTYAHEHCQCPQRPRGRRSASLNHVDWASTTCSQELNWYMDIALSTGDTRKKNFLRLSEFVVVYYMVGLGLLCRDTTCGRSLSPILVIFTHFLQLFLILNLNGVFCLLNTRVWGCGKMLMTLFAT